MKVINASDFLISSEARDLTPQHMRLSNDTLLRRVEPFPKLEFAEFRGNKLYVKVHFSVAHAQ